MIFEKIFIGVAALVVLVLALLFYRGFLKRQKIAKGLGLPERTTKRNQIIRAVSGVLLVIFLALGFLLPAIQNHDEVTYHTCEVLFLVDESRSMAAQKQLGRPCRLERAKQIMIEFSEVFPNLNLAIYGFTRQVRSHLYWTDDYDDFLRTVEGVVDIEAVPTTGTDIGKTIKRIINFFPEDSESKIVILLSDGENRANDHDLKVALSLAYSKGVKIIAIGVGEKEGATIPIYNSKGAFLGFEKVRGKRVVTYLLEPPLEYMAIRTGGVYLREDNLEEAFRFLDQHLVERKREVFTQDTILRKCFLILSLIPLYFLITKNW